MPLFCPGSGRRGSPLPDPRGLHRFLPRRPALRHRGVCIEGAVSVENVLDMVDWLPKNGFNAYYIQFREGHTFFERWYTHEGSVTQPAERYTLEDSRRHVARIEAEIRKRGLIYHKIGHGWTCECLGYPSTGWHTVEDEGVPPEIRPAAGAGERNSRVFRRHSAEHASVLFQSGGAAPFCR